MKLRKTPKNLYGILMLDANGFFVAGDGELMKFKKEAIEMKRLRRITCAEGEEFVIGVAKITLVP